MNNKLTLLEQIVWDNQDRGIGDLCNLAGTNERAVTAALARAEDKISNADIEAKKAGKPGPAKALYTFNWNEGGLNSVWAFTKVEAIKEIKKQFPGGNLTPNLRTLKRRVTKEDQQAYWDSLPLMD